MTAVLINQRLALAAVLFFFQSFLHTPNASASVPENVILSACQQQSSLNILNRDHDIFCQRLFFLRKIMKIQGRDQIAAPFCFRFYLIQ